MEEKEEEEEEEASCVDTSIVVESTEVVSDVNWNGFVAVVTDFTAVVVAKEEEEEEAIVDRNVWCDEEELADDPESV